MIFFFLFLTYFTLYNRFQVHLPHQNWLKCIPFYDSNIPLWICAATSLSIHLLMDVHLGHVHLGCFHVLAIINSAAVNSGIHVFFQFWKFFFNFEKLKNSSGYMPRSGISESYGSFIPVFFFLKKSPYYLP